MQADEVLERSQSGELREQESCFAPDLEVLNPLRITNLSHLCPSTFYWAGQGIHHPKASLVYGHDLEIQEDSKGAVLVIIVDGQLR